MKKLFVWEETRIGSGSAFGGTLCCAAETADDARGIIRKAFQDNPSLSGFESMTKIVCSDKTCANDWLEEDLAKEPSEMKVVLAFGGDY